MFLVKPQQVTHIRLKLKGLQTLSKAQAYDKKSAVYRKTVDLLSFSENQEGQGKIFGAGVYVIPFKLHLSRTLPGSFAHTAVDGDLTANVVYKLKAEAFISRPAAAKLKHHQEIVINEASNVPDNMPNLVHKDQGFTCCFCISRGTVAVTAQLDKAAYRAGEAVKLHLVLDNSSSKMALKDTRYSLMASLSIQSGTHKDKLETLIQENAVPRVNAGEIADLDFTITLPHQSLASCRTNSIKSSYNLSIAVKIPWYSDVLIDMPVTVYAREQASSHKGIVYSRDRPPNFLDTVDISTDMMLDYP